MVHSCAAYNCTTRFSKNSGVTFHSFPRDPVLKEQWILATKRKNFTVSASTKLCGRHFRDEDYVETTSVKRLKKDVVPSIFDFPKDAKKVPRKQLIKSEPEAPLVISGSTSDDVSQESTGNTKAFVQNEFPGASNLQHPKVVPRKQIIKSEPEAPLVISDSTFNDVSQESTGNTKAFVQNEFPGASNLQHPKVVPRKQIIKSEPEAPLVISDPTSVDVSQESTGNRKAFVHIEFPGSSNFQNPKGVPSNQIIIKSEPEATLLISLSTSYNVSQESTENSQAFVQNGFPGTSDFKTENRKRKRYVYPGDFTMADMKDSRKAMQMFKICQKQLQKRTATIKTLAKKNRRLLKKIRIIEEKLDHLQRQTEYPHVALLCC